MNNSIHPCVNQTKHHTGTNFGTIEHRLVDHLEGLFTLSQLASSRTSAALIKCGAV